MFTADVRNRPFIKLYQWIYWKNFTEKWKKFNVFWKVFGSLLVLQVFITFSVNLVTVWKHIHNISLILIEQICVSASSSLFIVFVCFVGNESKLINKLFKLFERIGSLFVENWWLGLYEYYIMKKTPDDVQYFFSLSVKIYAIVIRYVTFFELFQKHFNVFENFYHCEIKTLIDLIFIEELNRILSP